MHRRFLAILTVLVAAVALFVASPSVSAESPVNEPQKPENSQSKEVIVERGDTLIKIADKNESTYVRLYFANTHIEHPDLIYPGDKVRIPAAEEQLAERPLPAAVAPTQPVAAKKVYVAAPVASDGSVWDRLAGCESGGNWSINTGNGYYGGLQFNRGTWLSNGGGAYAPTANLASREQQIEIASRLQAARGWSPWPACTSKLGLR